MIENKNNIFNKEIRLLLSFHNIFVDAENCFRPLDKKDVLNPEEIAFMKKNEFKMQCVIAAFKEIMESIERAVGNKFSNFFKQFQKVLECSYSAEMWRLCLRSDILYNKQFRLKNREMTQSKKSRTTKPSKSKNPPPKITKQQFRLKNRKTTQSKKSRTTKPSTCKNPITRTKPTKITKQNVARNQFQNFDKIKTLLTAKSKHNLLTRKRKRSLLKLVHSDKIDPYLKTATSEDLTKLLVKECVDVEIFTTLVSTYLSELEPLMKATTTDDIDLALPGPSQEVIVNPKTIEETIDLALQGPTQEVIVSKFKLNVTRNDILTLSGFNLLNDNIINFYLELLKGNLVFICLF
jgi:hypothetical protein